MNARKLLTLAVAATVLVGGVAAVGAATPGNAPADQTPDDADETASDDADGADDADDAETNETDADANETDADAANASEAGPAANASENASAAAAGERGPPTELPDPVPERVSSIHEGIQSFLGGDVDNLGNALSGLLGDDGERSETDDETADENASVSNANDAAPVA